MGEPSLALKQGACVHQASPACLCPAAGITAAAPSSQFRLCPGGGRERQNSTVCGQRLLMLNNELYLRTSSRRQRKHRHKGNSRCTASRRLFRCTHRCRRHSGRENGGQHNPRSPATASIPVLPGAPHPPNFQGTESLVTFPFQQGCPSLRNIHGCLGSTACDLAASGTSDAAEKQTPPQVPSSEDQVEDRMVWVSLHNHF